MDVMCSLTSQGNFLWKWVECGGGGGVKRAGLGCGGISEQKAKANVRNLEGKCWSNRK